jgi:hypothetical protein
VHDLDRMHNQFEYGEKEGELGESAFESNLFESEYLGESSGESGYHSESQEMELAAELLGVRDENELDHFLGNLIGSIGGALSSAGKAVAPHLVPILKNVAKSALPTLGQVGGTLLGGPLGGSIGGQLGSAAANIFGLEMEGLSLEDREFETARGFTRFASEAARNVRRLPPGTHPREGARRAASAAARRYAPGLAGGRSGRPKAGRPGQGRPSGGRPSGGRVMSPRPGPKYAEPAPGCVCQNGRVSAQDDGAYDDEPDYSEPARRSKPRPERYDDFGDSDSGMGGRWVRHGNKLIIHGV